VFKQYRHKPNERKETLVTKAREGATAA